MIRNGQRVRLAREENAFLDRLVQEHVSACSVADYNARLDHAIRSLSGADPEELLFRRVLEGMKIE
jgi:hypothetical protein